MSATQTLWKGADLLLDKILHSRNVDKPVK